MLRGLAGATMAALALAACSSHDDPGTLSADQQQQLNDAAAMLDANSVSADAVNASEGNEQ